MKDPKSIDPIEQGEAAIMKEVWDHEVVQSQYGLLARNYSLDDCLP